MGAKWRVSIPFIQLLYATIPYPFYPGFTGQRDILNIKKFFRALFYMINNLIFEKKSKSYPPKTR